MIKQKILPRLSEKLFTKECRFIGSLCEIFGGHSFKDIEYQEELNRHAVGFSKNMSEEYCGFMNVMFESTDGELFWGIFSEETLI